jgi:hypothetical protein
MIAANLASVVISATPITSAPPNRIKKNWGAFFGIILWRMN